MAAAAGLLMDMSSSMSMFNHTSVHCCNCSTDYPCAACVSIGALKRLGTTQALNAVSARCCCHVFKIGPISHAVPGFDPPEGK